MNLQIFLSKYGVSIMLFLSTEFVSIFGFHDQMTRVLSGLHPHVGDIGVIAFGIVGALMMTLLSYAFVNAKGLPRRLAS